MSVSVAVVGAGRWGVNHVRVLSELRGSRIEKVYVVDENPSRAREVAAKYQCDGWFTSISDLVGSGHKVDAAVVAVPTALHYSVAAAIVEKMDLLVEKPLAASPEEGLELVKRARKAGKLLMVGHIERFNPTVHEVKIRAEELGGPLSIEAKRLGPGPAKSYTLNLGVAHDLLVHDVDVANFIIGTPPTRVYAITARQEDYPYEVEVQALYEYQEGVTAFLVASWRSEPHYKHRSLTVRTPSALIRADYILRRVVIDNGLLKRPLTYTETSYHSESSLLEISYLQPEPLKLELLNFIDSITGRSKPAVTGVDGYIALKCIVKAVEASVKRHPVEIEWSEISSLY
ncbi:MAG: Gfo/Idh/MocA family oxidoreductase [Thermofilum sp.]